VANDLSSLDCIDGLVKNPSKNIMFEYGGNIPAKRSLGDATESNGNFTIKRDKSVDDSPSELAQTRAENNRLEAKVRSMSLEISQLRVQAEMLRAGRDDHRRRSRVAEERCEALRNEMCSLREERDQTRTLLLASNGAKQRAGNLSGGVRKSMRSLFSNLSVENSATDGGNKIDGSTKISQPHPKAGIGSAEAIHFPRSISMPKMQNESEQPNKTNAEWADNCARAANRDRMQSRQRRHSLCATDSSPPPVLHMLRRSDFHGEGTETTLCADPSEADKRIRSRLSGDATQTGGTEGYHPKMDIYPNHRGCSSPSEGQSGLTHPKRRGSTAGALASVLWSSITGASGDMGHRHRHRSVESSLTTREGDSNLVQVGCKKTGHNKHPVELSQNAVKGQMSTIASFSRNQHNPFGPGDFTKSMSQPESRGTRNLVSNENVVTASSEVGDNPHGCNPLCESMRQKEEARCSFLGWGDDASVSGFNASTLEEAEHKNSAETDGQPIGSDYNLVRQADEEMDIARSKHTTNKHTACPSQNYHEEAHCGFLSWEEAKRRGSSSSHLDVFEVLGSDKGQLLPRSWLEESEADNSPEKSTNSAALITDVNPARSSGYHGSDSEGTRDYVPSVSGGRTTAPSISTQRDVASFIARMHCLDTSADEETANESIPQSIEPVKRIQKKRVVSREAIAFL